jgi:chemotaxis protein MotB
MRRILIVFVMLFFSCSVLAVADNPFPDRDRLEALFEHKVDGVYTETPRGLVISIPESFFFKEGSTQLKDGSIAALDMLAKLLHEIPNVCVIEDHTSEPASPYDSDWEISIVRSTSIFNYLVQRGGVPPAQIFPLGYGDFMPFRENGVRPGKMFDDRVDFVIVDYEVKR